MSDGYAAVVGAVNLDICGTSYGQLNERDSNPGRVTFSPGGVGRNIARNLGLLGLDVTFLTAVGDDPWSDRALADLADAGIGTEHALRVPGRPADTYIAINDAGGDMRLALSDMTLCTLITPEYLSGRMPMLNGAAAVAADANLTQEALFFLADHCTAPLFVDPVSAAKAGRLADLLDRIDTLKPNREEARRLCGVEIDDEASAVRAADLLIERGVRRVFLTLGRRGVLAAEGKRRVFLPAAAADTVSTSGAGDAFTAALIWAYTKGMDLRESALAASAAAAIAAEYPEAVNPALSGEAVLRRAADGIRSL